ncbi:helix-turn-helix transcriptional regulator [Terricaulis sp.]|uniref:helix-turn-helix transcriptional regulator n=1 Tax=Terricaulis sp. TaxID=2768686 RepID=UPI000AC04718|nr:helix-turn-helix transcriptional regulator [Terricaulis sp.]MDZ4691471.1 helix-turn-helix transcriptional regulator [Terricaulis sp.]
MPIENEIRRLRFENGEMTQAQLADRIGMTRQTVIAIEQNKYAPSLEAAFKIADAFGVPLEQVFRWTKA